MTTCDVFCRVIDNYGDAGFGWRLARTLQVDHGLSVRLVIDHPEIVERLCSGEHEGVQVVLWDRTFDAIEAPIPADIVVEAFSCRLPERYEAAIAHTLPRRPIAVFAIEYLTAEPFAEANNGLPSPHPLYGYPKTYVYPGYTPKTAGLLRERDFESQLDAFSPEDRRRTLARLGADPRHPFTFLFFTYPDFDTEGFVRALQSDGRPIQLLCAAGAASDHLLTALQRTPVASIQAYKMPFLNQNDFDRVLWSVDAALVRGEESPVRAQLSGLPFLWTLYRIQGGEHLTKAEAFAKLYAPMLATKANRSAWTSLFLSMNGPRMVFSEWSAWRSSIEKDPDIALAWRIHLNLSHSLTDFLCKRTGKV